LRNGNFPTNGAHGQQEGDEGGASHEGRREPPEGRAFGVDPGQARHHRDERHEQDSDRDRRFELDRDAAGTDCVKAAHAASTYITRTTRASQERRPESRNGIVLARISACRRAPPPFHYSLRGSSPAPPE